MIAVCLLTCGAREHVTYRTVSSFAAFNSNRRDLYAWHVDGGPSGTDQTYNRVLAERYGFATLWKAPERVGQIESFRFFMERILRPAEVPIEFMLWLENDWESTHPIPTLEFLRSFAEVDQWRLYGHRKNAAGGPRSRAGTKNLADGSALEWRPSQVVKGWEFTPRAHWGAGGTIVRPGKIAAGAGPYVKRMKDVIISSSDLRTMRPTKNIMNHIGLETTPGFFG